MRGARVVCQMEKENAVKHCITLMATKELSLLRLGFNEVADKMSRQHV